MDQEPEVPRVFNTRAELEEAAGLIAAKAPPELQHTVYLYFVARYLVVVYETRFAELPVQVWNEYRNAFDHYVRHVTKDPADTTNHVKKIEGHVQRAALDVCKLLWHREHARLAAELNAENPEALRLVDNGTFYPAFQTALAHTEKQFERAKMDDISLGDDAANNRAILGSYLDAFYSVVESQQLWASKRLATQTATAHVADIAARAAHQSKSDHFWVALLAKMVWAPVSAVVGAALVVAWEIANADDGSLAGQLIKLSTWLSKIVGGSTGSSH